MSKISRLTIGPTRNNEVLDLGANGDYIYAIALNGKRAAEIVAAVNLCRSLGIDPSAEDPLKAYRETVCDAQKTEIIAALDGVKAFKNNVALIHVIMAAPAPKEIS